MIRSMTGYGKQTIDIPGRKITIEIKILNSKQLDLNLKLPGFLREKEWEIRAMLSERFGRGKVDFIVVSESTGEMLNYSINRTLAGQYYRELKELAHELNDNCPGEMLSLVLKMPDVLQSSRDDLGDRDWVLISAAMAEAVSQAEGFRTQEGRILQEDILSRIDRIQELLVFIEPFEQQRIVTLREKMLRDFSRFGGEFNGTGPDPNRFEQELIYYLEKLDITEEKVRLQQHCRYFTDTTRESESQGKKLGFITQEIGREINTIGSKASDAEIQKLVVQMKDELEKVKEQLGNVL